MNLPTSQHFTLHRLADGVYAALHNATGGAVANAGIIDLGDRTLVFDTFMYPSAARDLRAAAEALFRRPVALVVNSHADRDHVFGNQVFPEATFYASEATRAQFGEHAEWLPGELQRLAADIDQLEAELAAGPDAAKAAEMLALLTETRERHAAFAEVTPTWPSCTFADAMEFHGPARSARLFTYGGGHSLSDALLYLPAERILFTGDLVFVEHHPSLVEGNPTEWLRILAQVELLAVDVLVPGHGPLGTMADLRTIRAYILELQRLAAAWLDVTVAPDYPVPAAYAAWEWPFLFGMNLRVVAGGRS